ncbi:hypothetical protein ES702_07299 [subsurface metagenome]
MKIEITDIAEIDEKMVVELVKSTVDHFKLLYVTMGVKQL